MTLQAKLDAFKADFEVGKPPYNVSRSVVETMHRATAELIASGAANMALNAGDRAPIFTHNDPDGKLVSSAEPARFLIGRDSVIRYAEVNPDYTWRPDPSELLPVLEGLASRQAA